MKNLLILILTVSICYSNLIKPESGSELTYVYVLFEWEQEPNAIAYNLQVSNQSSPNDILLDIEESTTVYIDTENFNSNYWEIDSNKIADIDDLRKDEIIESVHFEKKETFQNAPENENGFFKIRKILDR